MFLLENSAPERDVYKIRETSGIISRAEHYREPILQLQDLVPTIPLDHHHYISCWGQSIRKLLLISGVWYKLISIVLNDVKRTSMCDIFTVTLVTIACRIWDPSFWIQCRPVLRIIPNLFCLQTFSGTLFDLTFMEDIVQVIVRNFLAHPSTQFWHVLLQVLDPHVSPNECMAACTCSTSCYSCICWLTWHTKSSDYHGLLSTGYPSRLKRVWQHPTGAISACRGIN